MRNAYIINRDVKVFGFANILTFVNLAFGLAGIYFVLTDFFQAFLFCFVLCLVFDSLDGWYARLKQQESQLGHYLDSVADILSFGLLISIFVSKYIFGFSVMGIIVGVIYFAGNIQRHLSLVRPDSKSVRGITNCVSSLLIVALYVTNFYGGTWVSASLIVGLTALMLVPIDYFNHKSFKNGVLPQKLSSGLLYFAPILLAFKSLHVLWWVVILFCLSYITSGLLKFSAQKLAFRKQTKFFPKLSNGWRILAFTKWPAWLATLISTAFYD